MQAERMFVNSGTQPCPSTSYLRLSTQRSGKPSRCCPDGGMRWFSLPKRRTSTCQASQSSDSSAYIRTPKEQEALKEEALKFQSEDVDLVSKAKLFFSRHSMTFAVALAGAATTGLLSGSFDPDLLAQLEMKLAQRPEGVSIETWVLALALANVFPVVICIALVAWCEIRMNMRQRESDGAAATLLALCRYNNQVLNQVSKMMGGLEDHPSLGELAKGFKHHLSRQLDLQMVLIDQLSVSTTFNCKRDLRETLEGVRGELQKQGLTPEECLDLLVDRKQLPENLLTQKLLNYDDIVSLLLLRQRSHRMGMAFMCETLARACPPLLPTLTLIRIRNDRVMDAQDRLLAIITPPGLNAIERVRGMLKHFNHQVHAEMTPDQMLESVVGPWGYDPAMDARRAEFDMLMKGSMAPPDVDNPELWQMKAKLNKLFWGEGDDNTLDSTIGGAEGGPSPFPPPPEAGDEKGGKGPAGNSR